MTRTVAGLYRNFDDAQAAVNGLLNDGFDRGAIDLLASNAGGQFAPGDSGGYPTSVPDPGQQALEQTLIRAGEGAVVGGIAGIAIGLVTLLIPGVGPVLAMGPLAGALAGAELGGLGGGIVGSLAGLGLTEPEAKHYAEGIRSGGALVMVRTDTPASTRMAANILDRCDPVDISWGTWSSFETTTEQRAEARLPSNADDPDVYADEDSLTEASVGEGGIREFAARI